MVNEIIVAIVAVEILTPAFASFVRNTEIFPLLPERLEIQLLGETKKSQCQ
jgi:hypothetical protein